jgi:cytochrome c2
VNRQLIYIFSAALILIAGSMTVFFLKTILSVPSPKPQTVRWDDSPMTIPVSSNGYDGEMLYMSKCASCHHIFKDLTGPSLMTALTSGRWDDRKNLYEWIRDPAAFMKKDSYTKELKVVYGSMMTGFPNLKDEEIDAIVEYVIKYSQTPIASL